MTGIIDVHSHPLLRGYVSALYGQVGGDMPVPPWSPELHLETMDQHGIDVCMLSLPNLDEVVSGPDGAATARRLNEELAGLVAQHPDRFGAFGSLPMDDVDLAVEEARYALDELHLDGVALSTQHGGAYLGQAAFEPLLDELDRRGAVAFVHPGTPPGFDESQPLHVSALDFMFETTRMVAHMVLSGSRLRHPRVRLIATHAGGTVPYLVNRLMLISRMPWAYRGGPELTPDEVREGIASFYYDLTASASPMQLDALTAVAGTERLMMGFDFPMMPAATIAPAIAGTESYFRDAGVRDAVLRQNAARLFDRFDA